MKKIFDPVPLGNLLLKNRLIRGATLENGGAENHVITPLLQAMHQSLAEGGVGLIITGMMGVTYNSCVHGTMVRIDDDSFVVKFRESVAAVHERNCKIVVQLGHCGAKAMVIDEGDAPYAPSAITLPNNPRPAIAMSKQQIQALIAAYGDAAAKCKEAGADGVEIHGAHGYLISEFLSPYFNKRDDEYGGAIENRARLLFEVYDEIRLKVGLDYPILLKINGSDLVKECSTDEEIIWVCNALEKRNIDGIEISGGISVSPASASTRTGEKKEGFFAENALRLASNLTIPVISVGGYRTPEGVLEFLNKGNLAAISISRPLILDPALPRKWQNGENTRSACVSCNQCFLTMPLGCKVAQSKNK